MNNKSNGKSMTKKRYANVRTVSEYTSIPVKTLYEWSSVGRIPCIRLGRKLLYDLQEIDELMASLKRTNSQDGIVEKIIGDIRGNGI